MKKTLIITACVVIVLFLVWIFFILPLRQVEKQVGYCKTMESAIENKDTSRTRYLSVMYIENCAEYGVYLEMPNNE